MAYFRDWPLTEQDFDELRNRPVVGANIPVEA
jgi:hypothetical protein